MRRWRRRSLATVQKRDERIETLKVDDRRKKRSAITREGFLMSRARRGPVRFAYCGEDAYCLRAL